jgi:hypothetical protein
LLTATSKVLDVLAAENVHVDPDRFSKLSSLVNSMVAGRYSTLKGPWPLPMHIMIPGTAKEVMLLREADHEMSLGIRAINDALASPI